MHGDGTGHIALQEPLADSGSIAPSLVNGSSTRARDAAFDFLRSIALIRIILWHLFAQTWMTWFAAIPVMFFVAGSVLEHTGSHASFLRRRLGRILLPLWVYAAAVALICIWFRHLPGATGRGVLHALTWLLPVVDPTSTGWDGGWLSNHLWYLRAYVWMLALAPVLVRVSKRLFGVAAFVAISVVALELAARNRLPLMGVGTVRVVLGDAVVYGFFAVVGIRYRSAVQKPSPRMMAGASLLFGLAALVFAHVVGLSSEGVNGSYPAILLVGCAWLALLGAIERQVRLVAERPLVRRAAKRVSSRSLTVYLWHPACIVLTRRMVPVHGVVGTIALVPVTFALILLTVGLVGWVETVASGRPTSSRGITRSGVLRGAVATFMISVVALSILGGRAPALSAAGTTVFVVGIPAPSTREALSDSDFAPGPRPTTAIGAPRATDSEPFVFAAGVPVPASTESVAGEPLQTPRLLAFVGAEDVAKADVASLNGTGSRTPTRSPVTGRVSNTSKIVLGQTDGLTRLKSAASSAASSASKPKSVTGPPPTTSARPRTSTRKPSVVLPGNSTTISSTVAAGADPDNVISTVASGRTERSAPVTKEPATTSSAPPETRAPPPTTSGVPAGGSPGKVGGGVAKNAAPVADLPADEPARLNEAELQRALEAWRVGSNPRPKSMILALRSGTQTWVAKSPDGGVAFQEPDALFGAASLTKTFTAALVLREVERGTLSLDAPLVVVKGLEVPIPEGVTIRRLLTHTAGLVDYREAPGYHQWEQMTALKAVNLSFSAPQKDGLGKTVRYNNSGYLYLGLLLEQTTGRSYADLVAGLAQDAGLKNTRVDMTPQNGWVGFSSGGIASTAADLALWGQTMYTSDVILSARGVSLMTTIGDANLGLGAWPACPCWTDAGGVKRYTAIGHNTANGGMFYFPATGLTLVVMFESAQNDIVSLMDALSRAAAIR